MLGGSACPETLALALTLLDDPEIRDEAEGTVRRMAKALETSHPEAARAALQRVEKGK